MCSHEAFVNITAKLLALTNPEPSQSVTTVAEGDWMQEVWGTVQLCTTAVHAVDQT